MNAVTTDSLPARVGTLIVGTGFSGLAMAIHLKQAGIGDFVLVDKAADLGGTWRDNTYPGAECDVASALYSYSFEHNADWHYRWAEQAQILAYMHRVADKHGLAPALHFGRELVAAQWDEAAAEWQVRFADGAQLRCRFLVSAVGQLHHPAIPAIPGRVDFAGPAFHSAQWRHDIDLAGKRVAVIGNAASALQLIPQVAQQAANVTVFQRSANWVLPKFDRPYKPWEQWLADKLPLVARLDRLRIWLIGDVLLYAIMKRNRWVSGLAERHARRYLERCIADPALRAKLVPDYPIGAKRILFSDNYFQALARPNVEVVTDAIDAVDAIGIRCAGGRHVDADVIIYATGFRTNPFLAGMDIRGEGGRALTEHWRGGAHAWLGMLTAGFPNLFMMYGPNTNLGHNSILVMSEAQARWIVRCVQGLGQRGARAAAVRPEVEAAWNETLQRRLADTAWNAIAESWYKDGGRITNNWPGPTFEYLRRCRRVDWSALRLTSA